MGAVWFACLLKALPIFTGSFVSVVLAGTVGSQVSEFMGHPVSEGVIAHVAVAVDEHASAGQVCEHGAGISSGHMQVEGPGRVQVLPMRHEQDSQRKNLGLHDLNLSAYQCFLFGRGSQDCVAVGGRFRCGCFFANLLGVPVCLSPADLRKSQQLLRLEH